MAKRGSVTDKAVRNKSVVRVIEEQIGNMTQRHFRTDGPYRAVKAFLEQFARRAAHIAINIVVDLPDLNGDWKQDFADASANAMLQNGLLALVQEHLAGLRHNFPRAVIESDMNYYALMKIANCVGQTARMIKLGLDPQYLRLTRKECAQHQAELVRLFRKRGKPVLEIPVPVDATLN